MKLEGLMGEYRKAEFAFVLYKAVFLSHPQLVEDKANLGYIFIVKMEHWCKYLDNR